MARTSCQCKHPFHKEANLAPSANRQGECEAIRGTCWTRPIDAIQPRPFATRTAALHASYLSSTDNSSKHSNSITPWMCQELEGSNRGRAHTSASNTNVFCRILCSSRAKQGLSSFSCTPDGTCNAVQSRLLPSPATPPLCCGPPSVNNPVPCSPSWPCLRLLSSLLALQCSGHCTVHHRNARWSKGVRPSTPMAMARSPHQLVQCSSDGPARPTLHVLDNQARCSLSRSMGTISSSAPPPPPAWCTTEGRCTPRHQSCHASVVPRRQHEI